MSAMIPPPIESQLSRIERKVDELTEKLDAELNGHRGQAGIRVRMDRLEQTEERRTFWTRTIGATAVTAIVLSLWNFITGPKP